MVDLGHMIDQFAAEAVQGRWTAEQRRLYSRCLSAAKRLERDLLKARQELELQVPYAFKARIVA